MPIDLLKIAESVENTYQDVKLSRGTVRVYHVPEPLLWTYKIDRPRPQQPVVKMKTVGGFQERPSKAGDEGFDEWLKEAQSYEDELDELRLAARYVEALKDISYPDISNPPSMAQHRYNGSWPKDETLRKKIWLDFSIFSSSIDRNVVMVAIMELGGIVADDEVDEVKKNSESDSLE